jgi:malonate transporter
MTPPLSRLGDAGAQAGVTAGQAARNALKGVATNPMPWAILLGALVSALDLVPPQPVVQTVGLLADAASPVALFTIGAVLARSLMLTRSGHAQPLHWREYLPVAAAKLFLHPLLVLVVGTVAMYIGVPLDRFSLTALVLLAALPSASNVSLLAERFGADNGRVARIILVTTAAAFFTFSAAVALIV